MVDENRSVLGVITATDILGEKPVQVAVERGSARGEIQVRDIMTPQEHIEVLDMAAVRGAKVGHVVATLSKAGRQHAVVVERDRYGGQTVRGLFSATQIARQLGVSMQMTEVARTFSEIEATPPGKAFPVDSVSGRVYGGAVLGRKLQSTRQGRDQGQPRRRPEDCATLCNA